LESIVTWIVDTIGALGYPGILALMFLESSFFPFPSEVVMIPAGVLAFKGEMNMPLAITMGILGSLLGAMFNYWLAVKLGRPFLLRYGKYFLIKPDKMDKAERYFQKHGEITTFVGRLIPGVRQVISFPAGLARMNLFRFNLYTGIGAAIWVVILTVLGHELARLGKDWKTSYKQYETPIVIGLLIGITVVVGLYILVHYLKKRRQALSPVEEQGAES
jgi:membrane protein DedA with SNARE-associated domain